MRHTATTLLTASALLILSGCFHAQVVTSDSTPSTVVLDDPWADSWILGLVPPNEVNATDRCVKGVARVETRLSFLNQLVGALTMGIYTPMHVKVTCAA